MSLRVALRAESPEDIAELVRSASDRRWDVVAVLVPMRIFELARRSMPYGARCATHPDELASISVDAWFATRGDVAGIPPADGDGRSENRGGSPTGLRAR